MLPAVQFNRAKSFAYRVALGNTLGDVTQEGDAILGKVAEESRVVVRELPILSVPASVHDYLDVIVSHVQAFDRVYVQLLNQVTALTQMNDNLQRAYRNGSADNKQLINPYRGQLCIVKYSQNGQYYRAAVICRPDPVNVQVYCVDYGMTLTLAKEEILQLASDFNKLPPQAIAVQMKEVVANRISISLEQFKAYLEMKYVTVRLDAQKEDKYLVSMTITNEKGAPVNISDIVMGATSMPADQLSVVPQPSSAVSSSSLVMSTTSADAWREQESIPKVLEQQAIERQEDSPQPSTYPTPPLSERAISSAIVMKIDPPFISLPTQAMGMRMDGAMAQPSHFYVQLDRFTDQLAQILAEIKEPTTPLEEATIGAPCIASYLGGWYRAEIIAVNGQTLTLRYVDYGNIETKQPSDVYAITEEQPEVVRVTHKLAIPCQLIPVKPLDGNKWSDSAVEMFQSVFPEEYAAHIDIKEFREDDQMFLVELKIDERSVAESLVAQNATERNVPASTHVTKLESLFISTPSLEAVTRSDEDDSGSSSPSRFYVQLERVYEKVEQMLNEIKEPTVLLDQPTVGKACIANFAGGWYRAEIIAVNGDSLMVQYVDYGNMEEKKPTDVFAITDEQPDVVRHAHKLAVPCKLISNEGEELSVESFQAAFPVGQFVQVDVKGKEGELLLVGVVGNMASTNEESLKAVQESVAVGTRGSEAVNVTKIDAAVVSVPVQEHCVRSDDNVSSTPSRFYVQLERFYEKVQEMLNEIKEPTIPLDQPTIGKACIANFAGGWYRAEILAVNYDSLVVRYVDYGNVEKKKPTDVFAITHEQSDFVRLTHKLAIPCRLISKEKYTTDSFQEAFPEESTFQVNIHEQEGELFLVDVISV